MTVYNALQTFQAGELGRQHRRKKKYDNALSTAGKALQGGDYEGAAGAVFGAGDIGTGMKLAQYGESRAQAAKESEAAAQQDKLTRAATWLQHARQMAPEQRQSFFMSNAQAIMDQTGQDPSAWRPEDMTNQAIDEEIGKFQAMLGQAPAAPEPIEAPKLEETADGYVQWNAQTGQWENTGLAPPEEAMTPYQAEQLRLKQAELSERRRQFDAEQEARSRSGASELPGFFQGGGAPMWDYGAPPESGGGGFDAQWFTVSGGNGDGGFGGQAGANGDFGQAQPVPMINPQMYESYRSSSQGKADTERLEGFIEQSNIAQDSGGQLDMMEDLIDQDAPLGPMPELRATAADWGQSWNPFVPSREGAAKLRAFNSIATQFSLENFAAKTKGAISNSEMALFLSASPSWKTNREVARKVVQTMRQINNRVRERADAANKWSNMYGGLSVPVDDGSGEPRNFHQAWEDHIQRNPIVDSTFGSLGPVNPGDPVDIESGEWE